MCTAAAAKSASTSTTPDLSPVSLKIRSDSVAWARAPSRSRSVPATRLSMCSDQPIPNESPSWR